MRTTLLTPAAIARRISARLERDRHDSTTPAAVQTPAPAYADSPLGAAITRLLSDEAALVLEPAADPALLTELAALARHQGRVIRELSGRLAPLVTTRRQLDVVSNALSQAEAHLATSQQALAARDASLAQLHDVIAARDADIEALQTAATALEAAVAARDRTVAARDVEVAELGQVIRARDDTLADLRQHFEARGHALHRTDERVSVLERANQQLLQAVLTRDQMVQQLTGTLIAHALGATAAPGQAPAIGVTPAQGGTAGAAVAATTAARLADIQRRLLDPATLANARSLLEAEYAVDADPNLTALFAIYDTALNDGLPYWDMRIAARAASAAIQPTTYLEIGTRRGWSLAQVFAESPGVHAYVFDMWVAGYGDTQQGSPDLIRERMQRLVEPGTTPFLEFIDGNSHDTLPPFFAGETALQHGPRPNSFDLITVDGDHTRLGAWWDLYDIFPHVSVGGAVLFDDLDYGGDEELGGRARSRFERPPLVGNPASLLDVWLLLQKLYPNFVFLSSMRHRFRTGIAIRLS